MQALRLKSFDYRVLNLLLYGLRKEPVSSHDFHNCHMLSLKVPIRFCFQFCHYSLSSVYIFCLLGFLCIFLVGADLITGIARNEQVNEAHYEFLSISEVLVEIADDL